MDLLDTLIHLLSFAAPAFAVALLVALAAPVILQCRPAALAWWWHAAMNFAVGLAISIVGLWYFGVDGKMATYAGLVVAVASCQWLSSRAWKA